MAHRTSVIDWSGNYEENIERLARFLGKNKIRRQLFDVIYGYGSKPRSKKQLMAAAGIKFRDAQQAQNELDHLSGKGLIARVDNDGAVADGSRHLYAKYDDVRAHKEDIVKFANNRRLADKTPTKRRPFVRGRSTTNIIVKVAALRRRKPLNVLYLTADTDENERLRVDEEFRQVSEEIRGSKFRDNVKLHHSPAADLKSILNGLNDHDPAIVHFSGHGDADGIAVDNRKVRRPGGKFLPFELFAKALAATDTPPSVVVLNSCESAGAQKVLLPPAKAIVVMQDSITDLGAVVFASQFYAAIASGKSLQAAFDQGCVAIANASITEAGTPKLVCATGVDARRLVLT